MAIVFNNDLTLGLRGRVGKTFVFRSVGGRTIVSHAPCKPDPQKQSAAQRQTRIRFKEAAAWAVRTLMSAEKKLYYQRRARLLELPNAYIAAVRDYMRQVLEPAEQIRSVDHEIMPVDAGTTHAGRPEALFNGGIPLPWVRPGSYGSISRNELDHLARGSLKNSWEREDSNFNERKAVILSDEYVDKTFSHRYVFDHCRHCRAPDVAGESEWRRNLS